VTDTDVSPDCDFSGRLLTAFEVGEFLQVNPSWVLEAARRNAIPHIRLGRYFAFAEWISRRGSWSRDVGRARGSGVYDRV